MFDYAKFEASTKALKSEIEFLSALNIPEAKPAQKYWNEQTAPYLYQALVFEKLSLRLEKQMWEEAGMKIAAPFLDERFKSAAFIRSSLDGTKTALREAFVDSLGVRIAFQAKIPTFAPHPLEGPDAKAWAELFRQTQPLQKIFANSPDTGVNILNGMERLSPTSELRNRLMLRALSFHFGCRR
ncbi:MAG: hypothetical protein EOP05_22775 [Proteobacteria bacterium]|nr:MAG: hypothetical protein EOP05_22775 [Pseudomonadota bacterium]